MSLRVAKFNRYKIPSTVVHGDTAPAEAVRPRSAPRPRQTSGFVLDFAGQNALEFRFNDGVSAVTGPPGREVKPPWAVRTWAW